MRPPTAVVIVDEHTVLCEALSACLGAESDIRVVGTATDSSRVDELVTAHRPDVVLVDADLGDPDLTALVGKVQRALPSAALIVLSGTADAQAAAAVLQEGVTALVLKAAPLSDVLDAVRAAAAGRRWLSPALLSAVIDQVGVGSGWSRRHSRLSSLSDRELEVLGLMVDGLGNAAIARRLNLSVNTVRTHTQHLQSKLSVHSAVEAVSVALDSGLRPA